VAKSVPLANALRDIAWLLPRTLGRAPNPTRLLPRSELEVMRLLAQRPGLSVNEAAAELGLQPPNLSTAVRSLVNRGQLERRPDPADGRIVRLFPTALALEIRSAQEQAWGAALDMVLAELDPADAERLRDCSDALGALARALARHDFGAVDPEPQA
jgi:DNA-binding MarR family transcriptional regulator